MPNFLLGIFVIALALKARIRKLPITPDKLL